MNVCENLKIKHIMLPGSLAGARVSHKTKWSLKSRVVYVAKILWCWKKAEIITLKVSTEEEEEVQLKLSEDFFRFWGVVIIVISFSGREQTLSGWVKGAGSHDIAETSWTCYLNTPYMAISLKSEDPMICFHLRQLGGRGLLFARETPFSGPWQISNKIPPDEYAGGQEHKQDCDSEAVSGRSRGFSAQFRPLIAQARIHTSSHWTEMQKAPYLPRPIWAYPGGVGAP